MTPREAYLNGLWMEIVLEFQKGDAKLAAQLEATYATLEAMSDEAFTVMCDCYMTLAA